MNTPDNLNRGYEIRETANRWMASFANYQYHGILKRNNI